ncbi:MAG: glutathione transferase GstA [Acidiferrobacteraceae bacterium]
MKLYYAPGACSMATHIALCEAKLPHDLEQVDLRTHKTAKGEDFTKINPKGYVPALRIDDAVVLTENVAVLQYVADQTPQAGLAPKAGTLERYRLVEWLAFISTEVHKQFSPFFRPNVGEDVKAAQMQLLGRRFDYLSERLSSHQYLLDGDFTVADAYLFTVLNWTHLLKIDLGKWPAIVSYMKRVGDRPGVREAMRAEGLVK